MTSMTGYASREVEDGDSFISCEVRSVNGRHLDINVSLPSGLLGLEARVRGAVGARARRGRVDVSIRSVEGRGAPRIEVNLPAARAYHDALRFLAQSLGMDERPTLADILRLDGVLSSGRTIDVDHAWTRIQPVLAVTLDAWVAARESEGSRLRAELRGLAALLRSDVQALQTLRPGMEAALQLTVQERISAFSVEGLPPERLAAELALLASRASVREELTRLESHCEELETMISQDSEDGVGKRLDFLAQELGREFNTIASKSSSAEASRLVVEAKQHLEDLREQARNVQ